MNGVLQASSNAPGILDRTDKPLTIGANSVWGEYFAGTIDEVRIYNRVLTASEIQGDMQNSGEPLPGTLSVTPSTSAAFNGPFGGPFSPNSYFYTLKNPGVDSIDFLVSANQNFVSLAPTAGTLAPGATVNVAVTIANSGNSLALGSYDTTVTFTNVSNDRSTTSRQASLNIYDPMGQPWEYTLSLTCVRLSWELAVEARAPVRCVLKLR